MENALNLSMFTIKRNAMLSCWVRNILNYFGCQCCSAGYKSFSLEYFAGQFFCIVFKAVVSC